MKKSEATNKCKRGCTCHLNKGATIQEAACDLVNEFLIVLKLENLNLKELLKEKEISKAFFINFSHLHYSTKDGKDNDIKAIAKFAQFVVEEHVRLNNIETIDHVKPKKYENGQFGWTSCHNN